jgi:hypothetical protein
LTALFGGLALASCTDGTGPVADPSLECVEASTQTLAVGEHRIINPVQSGACVRFPGAGGSGAEHLYLPVGTEGQESEEGASAPYAVSGSAPVAAAALALRQPLLSAFQPPLRAEAFHGMLRERERALSRSASAALFNQGPTRAPPPVVGDQRTFNVCSSTSCDAFVEASATAKAVGERVAVYVDDAAPANGYSDPDLVDIAALFDDYLYPIDTLAFGRESDIDGNGVVIVLLTHRVNALSPNCSATQSVILGYFFGADLLARSSANPGSNESEIFFGLVPDPGNPNCTISQFDALRRLPATFIHEFQHMISFNQHRLVRGASTEDTWLNEGLSHFAEELGGRLVPDGECPNTTSCLEEFAAGNLVNALSYLHTDSLESSYLVVPSTASVRLRERGAVWLFVRWLVDHFAADSVLGTDLTQRLVATNLVGSANVATQTGTSFTVLVPEWQLANYLDDLPGFDQPSARLRYKTWNLRAVAEANLPSFPLIPDSTAGPGYSHQGVLLPGSGRHVRVVQAAAAGPVDIQLSGAPDDPFPLPVDPRITLVRIR